MKDGSIDYSRYTPSELREALEGINPATYPKNYEKLKVAYRLAFPKLEVVQKMATQAEGDEDTNRLHYAGFWLRFGAMWLDLLVYVPVIALSLYFGSKFRLFNLYWLAPGILLGIWFNIYLVFRYGGTPGKLLLGIRIAMIDGSNVTLRAAIIRHIVLLVLSILSSVALVLATLKMSDSQYAELGFIKRSELLVALAPRWYNATSILSNVWFWSEFLTMLFNRERRAIHDFMAGTVVIKRVKST